MVRIRLRVRRVAVVSAVVACLLAGCQTTPSNLAAPATAPGTSVGQSSPAAPAPESRTAPSPAEPSRAPAADDAPVRTTAPTPAAPAAEPSPPTAPALAATPTAELKPATLIGSEETSTMLDNLTVYVVSIDDRNLSAGRDGWSTPLKLKPGLHRVGAAFARGVFSARAELRFEAESGVAYQIRFATDAQLFGRNTYCEFWIEEVGTGERAVEPTRVALQRTGGH